MLVKQMVAVAVIAFTALITGAWCLNNVSIFIHPPAVERDKEATLHCQYDLQGAPLYAVKWYRGFREFYRYSPNDNPRIKIFPYEGINVDLSMSNATQVVLRHVGFNLSGNLSCEVTTDAPSFSTAVVSKELMVIELPKRGPTLLIEKERYDVGDILKGNCTASPSKPPAELKFYINNIEVTQTNQSIIAAGKGLQKSYISVQLRVEPAHMSQNGNIIIRCTALVATLYRQSAQISLGPRTSEPVPERVTSPSCCCCTFPSSLLLTVIMFTMFAR
ncbi:uncharacterized protein [Rhodnius prolixus]|uniref:uncharacterized protein n=1 Tax=Rhodnius prolixus TaxID=13249 RepID=UPI003D18A745